MQSCASACATARPRTDFHGRCLGPGLSAGGRTKGYCVFDLDGVDFLVEAVPTDAPAEA